MTTNSATTNNNKRRRRSLVRSTMTQQQQQDSRRCLHDAESTDSAESTTVSLSTITPPLRASLGDIVTIDLDLRPEDGYVPENLFDATGRISFVLGWGNYLPALHELVTEMAVGETLDSVSIDAGFGQHHADLLIKVPKSNLKRIRKMDEIIVGATLHLEGNIKVQVVQVDDDSIVVDANHPLAGSSFSCSLKVISIDKMPAHKMVYRRNNELMSGDNTVQSSPYEVATLAMGCFWGIELAMMRIPGVVGTRAGYTQGTSSDPSYQDVCQGKTKHREAVMVIYDSRIVSYEDILNVYADRLAATESQYKINIFQEADDEEEDDDSFQYKNGIYFHNAEQRQLAMQFVDEHSLHRYDVELLEATTFYDAEESHQQYLYKGGQPSRKNARETIRCFG